MKQDLKTLLFLLATTAVKKLNSARFLYKDMAHLRIKLAYLKFVKTSRMLFVSFLGIGVCLVFLMSSLLIFHVVLFCYAPLTNEAKMWIGLLSAIVYLAIALKAFSYVFAESKWLEIFNTENILKDLQNESLDPQEVRRKQEEALNSN